MSPRRLLATVAALVVAVTSCTTTSTETSSDTTVPSAPRTAPTTATTTAPAATPTAVPNTVVDVPAATVASTVAEAGDSNEPTIVVLDRVRVEFPADALTNGARVEVNETQHNTNDETLPGVNIAGNGIDVSILDGDLIGDANVTFTVDAPSDPNAIPVVLHIADDGTVTIDDATYANGQIQISTDDFSLRIPAWLNPVNWIKSLFGGLTRLAGLRTTPPDCRTAPDWAVMLGANTTAVHECMSTNPDGIAEIVIKSNRSYWMEITVPQPNRWVWVSNTPGFAHDVLKPNTYLLPPGETMTIGLDRPTDTRNIGITIDRTNTTILLSAVSIFFGDAGYTGELFTLAKCGQQIHASRDNFASFTKALFGCAVDALSGLDDPGKAAQAAEDVFGPNGAIDPNIAPALDKQAQRFKGVGKVLKFVQAALSAITSTEQFADELFDALGDTTTVQVVLHASPPATTTTTAAPAPATTQPPVTTPATTPAVTTPSTTQPPATTPPATNPQSDASIDVRWGTAHSTLSSSRYVFVSGRNWPAGARIEIQCSDSIDGIYADTNANVPVTYRDRFADSNGNFDIVDANPGICYSNVAATIRVWAPGTSADFTTNLAAPTPTAPPATTPPATNPPPTTPTVAAPSVDVRWGDRHNRYSGSRYVFVSGRNWPAGARIEIQCSDSIDGIYADTNANVPVTYRDRFADSNGNFDIVDANPGICYSNVAATIRVWAPGTGADFTTNLASP